MSSPEPMFLPLHGIVWVTSVQSLAVILQPELIENRMGCFLISDLGFDFNNMCNFGPSSGIIDAAPMLKRFEECVLNTANPPCSASKAFSIGVALLVAANKILAMCKTNRRIFPWTVFSPDVCLSAPMIRAANPSTLKMVYDEAYRNFSVLIIERGTLNYMEKIAKDDAKKKKMKKKKKKREKNPVFWVWADISRHAQSALRTHVKYDASTNAARKFVHEYTGETECIIAEDEEGRAEGVVPGPGPRAGGSPSGKKCAKFMH